ncbi:hypothetical protein Gorai_006634 [Gossypium raimondii]|uniref:Uncharacterized protein n=1 Tax=Gossypium raimondii TaxID=29730 RepID=A0A7J8QFX9_GOSRA|nr:hypothetical protein [Gossypium raimondii]
MPKLEKILLIFSSTVQRIQSSTPQSFYSVHMVLKDHHRMIIMMDCAVGGIVFCITQMIRQQLALVALGS